MRDRCQSTHTHSRSGRRWWGHLEVMKLNLSIVKHTEEKRKEKREAKQIWKGFILSFTLRILQGCKHGHENVKEFIHRFEITGVARPHLFQARLSQQPRWKTSKLKFCKGTVRYGKWLISLKLAGRERCRHFDEVRLWGGQMVTSTDVRRRPNDYQEVLFLCLFNEGHHIEAMWEVELSRTWFVHIPRYVHRN